MNMFRRILCILLSVMLLAGAAPAVFAQNASGVAGNTDLNISNGGILCTDGDTLYHSEAEGIYAASGGEERLLTAEVGRNLNRAGAYLYYTLPQGLVRRVPVSGGSAETVYAHGADILRLYVMDGDSLLFLSDGKAYSCGLTGAGLRRLDAPEGLCGLIPTVYGTLYLTGDLFDYTLWAGKTRLLEHVASCYTDSGYLAVTLEGESWQIPLPRLFDAFDPTLDIAPFHIHEGEAPVSLLSLNDGEDGLCAECEAQAAAYYSARLMSTDLDAGLTETEETEPVGLIPAVSEGQANIVRRARQLHEIQWTPLENRYQWGGQGTFAAETTYTGLPYGQPVNTGYVPWTVSLDAFLTAVNDNTSKFYTTYSTYNKTAPSFSCDCSAFVSYAWGLKTRCTTRSLPSVSEKISDQSIYSMQIGDALNNVSSHVVLVSDVRYNDAGELVSVEIMEQTPVITKLTLYGEGGQKSLSQLQSYYLGGGYGIYRNPERDSVVYTHSCAVPLDGDTCAHCTETAPKSKTTSGVGYKTVELYHTDAGAAIYYTLDGSTPSAAGTRYTGPITVQDTTLLRAIAVTGNFSGSSELKYTVKLPNAAAPTITVSAGLAENGLISRGSQLSLSTATAGAVIYYTLDGSAPSAASTRYTGPIAVNTDVTIRAVAQALGMHESDAVQFTYRVAETYTITASALAGGSISPSGSIQALGSSSKTFQIMAETGYKLTDVLVDGVSIGAVATYTFKDIAQNHTIFASFISTASLPFQDVGEGNWFYSAVSYAYRNQLFSGTSNSTFSPNDSMTRGMFVTVLGRYAGVPAEIGTVGVVTASQVRLREAANTQSEVLAICEKNDIVDVRNFADGWYQVVSGSVTGWIREDLMSAYDGRFADVATDKYYGKYVAWASLTGISNGTSTNSYAPDQNITREQMCVLLYNYMRTFGKAPDGATGGDRFTDDASISGYAKDAVYALKNAGLISGVGDGSFNPKGTATRAQVAQLMMNFIIAL